MDCDNCGKCSRCIEQQREARVVLGLERPERVQQAHAHGGDSRKPWPLATDADGPGMPWSERVQLWARSQLADARSAQQEGAQLSTAEDADASALGHVTALVRVQALHAQLQLELSALADGKPVSEGLLRACEGGMLFVAKLHAMLQAQAEALARAPIAYDRRDVQRTQLARACDFLALAQQQLSEVKRGCERSILSPRG